MWSPLPTSCFRNAAGTPISAARALRVAFDSRPAILTPADHEPSGAKTRGRISCPSHPDLPLCSSSWGPTQTETSQLGQAYSNDHAVNQLLEAKIRLLGQSFSCPCGPLISVANDQSTGPHNYEQSLSCFCGPLISVANVQSTGPLTTVGS